MQILLSTLGNMDPPRMAIKPFNTYSIFSALMTVLAIIPRYSSRLHLIRYSHIGGPNIKLPPLLSEHSSQHSASVNTHTHVHLCFSLLPNITAAKGRESGFIYNVSL